MRVDVLQAVAICCHGNVYLANPAQERLTEMHGSNSTFRTVYEVAFERRGVSSARPGMAPEGTAAWLKGLGAEGVDHLVMSLQKCSLDAAKQGTDQWGIIADGDRGCEIWQPLWRSRSLGNNDATPWRVLYNGERFNRWSLTPIPTSEEAESKLAAALTMAHEFCLERHLTALAQPLLRCSELQSAGNPEMIGFPDLAPAEYPRPARALIASALRVILVVSSSAWNPDIAGEDYKAEFLCNTLRLWHGACLALEAAASSGLTWAEPTTAPAHPRLEAS